MDRLLAKGSNGSRDKMSGRQMASQWVWNEGVLKVETKAFERAAKKDWLLAAGWAAK